MNIIPKKVNVILKNALNRDEYSLYKIFTELDNVKKLYDSYNELEDYEKYNLINRYYYTIYDIDDITDLINTINNTNYDRYIDIPTNMESEQVDYSGHKEDFKWWTIYSKLHVICASSKNDFSSFKDYSYDELNKLIDNKIVFPVELYQEEIPSLNENYEPIKFIKTLNNYGIEYGELKIQNITKQHKVKFEDAYYDINISNKQISNMVKLYDKYIDEYFIKETIKNYLKELIDYIETVGNELELNNIENMKLYYKEISNNMVRRRIKEGY